MAKLKTVGIWALQVLLTIPFLLVGGGKLLWQSAMWAGRFDNWGYPEGFSLVIGVVETLCAVGLLVPRVAGIAAAVLIVVMAGALGTHLLHGEPFWGPLMFGGLLAVIAYARRPSFLRQSTSREESASSQPLTG